MLIDLSILSSRRFVTIQKTEHCSWRFVFFILSAEAFAIILFYSISWSWLRAAHALMLQAMLRLLDCNVQSVAPFFMVEQHAFAVDADCTYVDLILCGLPLLWRTHRNALGNFAWMVSFVAAVTLVNIPRMTLAVYVTAHGGSWFWSHDMIDHVLWYPTLGLIAISWIRSLKLPVQVGKTAYAR
jgi:hypothetical protein